MSDNTQAFLDCITAGAHADANLAALRRADLAGGSGRTAARGAGVGGLYPARTAGELGDPDLRVEMVPVPLARSAPTWTPAAKAVMMMLIGSMISLHSQGLADLFDVQTSCTRQ